MLIKETGFLNYHFVFSSKAYMIVDVYRYEDDLDEYYVEPLKWVANLAYQSEGEQFGKSMVSEFKRHLIEQIGRDKILGKGLTMKDVYDTYEENNAIKFFETLSAVERVEFLNFFDSLFDFQDAPSLALIRKENK